MLKVCPLFTDGTVLCREKEIRVFGEASDGAALRVMLLDPDDPAKVIGMAKKPILRPETKYELEGFRGSVIFPGGMILAPDGEVKIYYGGADTVECLATASAEELLAMIEPC